MISYSRNCKKLQEMEEQKQNWLKKHRHTMLKRRSKGIKEQRKIRLQENTERTIKKGR
jgi:hypothetical protein